MTQGGGTFGSINLPRQKPRSQNGSLYEHPNETRFSMKAKPKPPTAPKHLKAATKRWWLSVVADYELEPHHLRLLTLAAESWDRCTQAREVLATEGLTFDDRFNQPKSRPEVAVERDCRLAFARLLRELSLDDSTPETPRPPRTGGRQW